MSKPNRTVVFLTFVALALGFTYIAFSIEGPKCGRNWPCLNSDNSPFVIPAIVFGCIACGMASDDD
jgi:hypothetical protein